MQSYEFRSEEAVFGFVVLKGHYPACQWNIIKYDAVYKKIAAQTIRNFWREISFHVIRFDGFFIGESS